MAKVNPIPKGYHTITPTLYFDNRTEEAIEFYRKAFGAETVELMKNPDGSSVVHGVLRFGDSMLMVADAMPNQYEAPASRVGHATGDLFLYVKNVDELYQRALKAGAKEVMPLADQFWGDRFGKLRDPYGYTWGLASRVEEVSRTEMNKRAKKWFEEQGRG